MQKLRREEQRESLANGFRAEKEGAYEMNIEMTGEPESFTFTIEDAFDEAGRLTLEYDCETKRVTLELEGELAAGRTKRTVNVENLKTLRILADTSCLEIYLNNGEKVMTTRYYLSNSKSIVSISKMSGELKIWDLNHMNIDYGL